MMAGTYTRYFLLILLFVGPGFYCCGQVPQWAFNIGSAGADDGYACAVGPNGNVYLGGSFSGTVDLDPSANTYNVSSNGPSDIFLACYTSSGNFLWGFSIGGPAYDGITAITVDKMNNVVIAGYFSGQSVAFDPAANSGYLSDQGTGGAGNGSMTGGDGFVAKYSSGGSYQWAIDLGGSSFFDLAEAVSTDAAGNVYVGGDFHFTMDIDPSANVTLLNSLNGTAYLVKYTSSGQLVRGFCFGGGGNPGVDNTVAAIQISGQYVYAAGCFHGTSDFDPSPASAYLSASGIYDAYLVRYDTAGNYNYAIDIGGNAEDQARAIALDSAGNIYTGGYTYSPSITFGPGSAAVVQILPSGGSQDIFLAKYDSSGQYQWAKVVGSKHDDVLYGIAVSHNNLYYTGYFHDTVDFDPSPGVANLISNGQGDIYLCKDDLDGNYICAFGIGNEGSDRPRQVMTDTAGYLYMCGVLASTNTDMDPGASSYLLSSNGAGDALLAKYDWRMIPAAASGYLQGDTVCAGTAAKLTFVATSGSGPFSIIYSHGNETDTLHHVDNGAEITVSPDTTSVYRLLSIQGAGICVPEGYPDTPALIVVRPIPEGYAGPDTVLCPGIQYVLHAMGGSSYVWFPSINLSDPTVPNPIVTVRSNIDYQVAISNAYGCSDTTSVFIGVFPAFFSVKVPPVICKGVATQVTASGGDSYLWLPDSLVSNDSIANPIIKPQVSSSYAVVIKENTCGRRDTLAVHLNVHPLPDVSITDVYDIDCGHRNGQLKAEGAMTYSWYPTTGLDDPYSPEPNVQVPVATRYVVTGMDAYGCQNKDSATVQVFNDGTGRLFVPNAFTPNGDGKNDCFRVRAPGNLSDFELMVYDRWGNRVFLSYNANECWDGKYHGVAQPVGTYFYQYAALSGDCGYIKGEGDVTLIR